MAKVSTFTATARLASSLAPLTVPLSLESPHAVVISHNCVRLTQSPLTSLTRGQEVFKSSLEAKKQNNTLLKLIFHLKHIFCN
ncbi:hypothetical protein U1Q18_037551 [Sarracenia purpurea var. burkii]